VNPDVKPVEFPVLDTAATSAQELGFLEELYSARIKIQPFYELSKSVTGIQPVSCF